MDRVKIFNFRSIRLLGLVILLGVALAAAADPAARPVNLLDAGAFPTPTPTATLIPTLAPATPTLVPPSNLIPTATSIPYPFPTLDSNIVGGSGSQAESSSRSPSIAVLALPFLCALGLLIGVGVYWFRNTRSGA